MNSMVERNEDMCRTIFMNISTRQIQALMFHGKLADLYDFLGLMGFKRLHEYQYLVESAGMRGIHRYYINHHNKLLEDDSINDPDVIPKEWIRYTRFDVTPQVRKQATEKSFEQYQQWETETKMIYEGYAKQLLENGFVADYNKVMSLVKDVDQELKTLDRLIIELKSVSYDPIYLATIQNKIHECYREKEKEIGIDIC